MESVLASAVRKFQGSEHIKNVREGAWTTLYDETGTPLIGIRGRMGACSFTEGGYEIGVDLVEMEPGSAFPLHTHEGDHILVVSDGIGIVHIDGVDHPVSPGDTIFVAAEYPHGVKTVAGSDNRLTFLAFGHPHKALDAHDRMHLVK